MLANYISVIMCTRRRVRMALPQPWDPLSSMGWSMIVISW